MRTFERPLQQYRGRIDRLTTHQQGDEEHGIAARPHNSSWYTRVSATRTRANRYELKCGQCVNANATVYNDQHRDQQFGTHPNDVAQRIAHSTRTCHPANTRSDIAKRHRIASTKMSSKRRRIATQIRMTRSHTSVDQSSLEVTNRTGLLATTNRAGPRINNHLRSSNMNPLKWRRFATREGYSTSATQNNARPPNLTANSQI
ncbi:ubiquitin carboxyl-terminal hydrolase 15-like [Dorcoceras hygrometricum]|uniref:Ubiquitin carboxyl-terminal hydrolase 15-like n=1 Tax=Dorcoceras hygrometricum TaxID=472368 RepID=A0A2Z6ZZF7_9LAMI|nr:ubiquitin carboxyl-terminal hydrolase 15-like [Dorcoceras hygrometricum]